MANEIRTIFYIFVIVSYFVRQGDLFGEQNTNAGHFRPEVVFCSPFRHHGAWNTSEKIQSPNDRFWCVYQVPVCECVFHSGRLRYAFPPNDICALAPKELRIRPEGVTHSPRMVYAFAPKVLRIRPEGVTHSPRRCYAFVWANKIRPFVLLGHTLQTFPPYYTKHLIQVQGRNDLGKLWKWVAFLRVCCIRWKLWRCSYLQQQGGHTHLYQLGLEPEASQTVPAPSLVGGWTILYWTSAENTHSLPADSWRNIIQTSFTYMTCYSADKRTHLHMKSNLTTNNNIEAHKYLLIHSSTTTKSPYSV